VRKINSHLKKAGLSTFNDFSLEMYTSKLNNYRLFNEFNKQLNFNGLDNYENYKSYIRRKGLIREINVIFGNKYNDNLYKVLYFKAVTKRISDSLWLEYVHRYTNLTETYAFGRRKSTVSVNTLTKFENTFKWDSVRPWEVKKGGIYKRGHSPRVIPHKRAEGLAEFWFHSDAMRKGRGSHVHHSNFMRLRFQQKSLLVPDFSFLGSRAWCMYMATMSRDPVYLVDSVFMDSRDYGYHKRGPGM
jgi:hypothetical protein